MLNHGEEFGSRLLDIFQKVPALADKGNRDILLRGMPAAAVAITRSGNQLTDLNGIISAAESWGQLDNGQWPLAILVNNALRLTSGSQAGRELTSLLEEFEPAVGGAVPPPMDEVIIGKDERVPPRFLQLGLVAAKSVAKIIVKRFDNGCPSSGSFSGTGWLIGPDLLITNHHVINARSQGDPVASPKDFELQATNAKFWFGYDNSGSQPVIYSCIKMLHSSRTLDYALLRISQNSILGDGEDSTPLSEWGHLPILSSIPALQRGDRLNIIQHPQGGVKLMAIRSNYYFGPGVDDNTRVRYLTDTEPGSSGSPVMDDNWQVLALHHCSVPVPASMYKGETIKFNNQGVLIKYILDDLPPSLRSDIMTIQASHAPNYANP